MVWDLKIGMILVGVWAGATIFWGLKRPVVVKTEIVVPTQGVVRSEWGEPVAEFRQRITKKFFGMYITPKNSPVLPERFTGYHTGVDVEYQEVASEVPVSAIADGIAVTSEYASGYGGVIVIKHGEIYAIYGHLRPVSMVKVGTVVKEGEQIGVLGTGYSWETDGERRHLHLGISKTNTIKGYVATKAELAKNWLDPLTLRK